MKFMLDMNICIYIIKKKPISVINNIKKHSVGDICISSITLAELQYGVEKSMRVQMNRHALEEFILPLEIADFDEKAAYEYGVVRSMLEKSGKLIGSMDMLIGAHALSRGLILVTANTKEFSRIKKLKIIDWSSD